MKRETIVKCLCCGEMRTLLRSEMRTLLRSKRFCLPCGSAHAAIIDGLKLGGDIIIAKLRAENAALRKRVRLARRELLTMGVPYTLALADLLDLRKPLPKGRR